MAQYANQGDTALTLAEECAEVIQIITKMKRFNGDWNEVPPGKDKTRWQMLEEEMNDLLLAWDALKKEQSKDTDDKPEINSLLHKLLSKTPSLF